MNIHTHSKQMLSKTATIYGKTHTHTHILQTKLWLLLTNIRHKTMLLFTSKHLYKPPITDQLVKAPPLYYLINIIIITMAYNQLINQYICPQAIQLQWKFTKIFYSLFWTIFDLNRMESIRLTSIKTFHRQSSFGIFAIQ